jgi:hypothetical protein
MARAAGPTAALAGLPAGIQGSGAWLGRRQMFVRFAAEAETAVMYTADALASELTRTLSRSVFHSVAIAGRDPLANAEYLKAAFEKRPPVPVMLDCDGQRPEAIDAVASSLSLVQVTLEGGNMMATGASVDAAVQTIANAARAGVAQAMVLIADERSSDSVLLRIVEQARAGSESAQIVIHPAATLPVDRDRRWTTLMERAAAVHPDIVFSLRLPPPTGMR